MAKFLVRLTWPHGRIFACVFHACACTNRNMWVPRRQVDELVGALFVHQFSALTSSRSQYRCQPMASMSEVMNVRDGDAPVTTPGSSSLMPLRSSTARPEPSGDRLVVAVHLFNIQCAVRIAVEHFCTVTSHDDQRVVLDRLRHEG